MSTQAPEEPACRCDRRDHEHVETCPAYSAEDCEPMSTPTPAQPKLTHDERTVVEAAIEGLQDIAVFGTPDAPYAGVDDTTAAEQVEMTREAVALAMKVVTKFRARAVRSGEAPR